MTVVSTDTTVGGLVDELREELPRRQVPGAQVAVVHDGAVVCAEGVGVRDVTAGDPVTADTLFDHGSCAKSHTSLLGAVLHERGVLDLDAPVRTYVPELELPDAVVAERVTTRDLLSHRSGLGRHDLAWILSPSWDAATLVGHMAHLPMAGDLRAQMAYSNLGYALAGVAVERATGGNWHDALRAHVLTPAGMDRTVTRTDAFATDADRSAAHVVRDGALRTTAYRSTEAIAPAGQLRSSAADAARWLLVQTGGGAVSAPAVAATHRLAVPMDPDLSPHPLLDVLGYGLGWVVLRFRDEPAVWHSGGVDGFRTDTIVLPRRRVGALVSGNVFPSTLPMAAVLRIVDALLGHTDVDWYAALGGASEPADEATSPPTSSAPPTHPLSEYAGTYVDPGYGELAATVESGALRISIGESALTTTHRHFDTWDVRYEPLSEETTATFVVDADGLVAEVVVPLDDAAGPTRFRRRPASDGAA